MQNYPITIEIYHFTHIDNLSTLISIGAILCKNEMTNGNYSYKNSALDSVQEQRQLHKVPVPPNGTIHDYVPFYFNSLSPMLYTIKKGNIGGVEMQDLVFFKSTVQAVKAAGCVFIFTSGHAIMNLSEYYNDLADLDKIPWDVIKARRWDCFPDGGRLRQSEFLVYKKFDWKLVETIGVYNNDMLSKVTALIGSLQYKPIIKVKPKWFFSG